VCYVVAKNWNGAEVCSTASSTVTTAAGTSAFAPIISSVASVGGFNIVTWYPGPPSYPAAAEPSFYVACVAGSGAACPTGVTFDVNRPSRWSPAVTTVGSLAPPFVCYVVAKNWDGAEVCSSGVVFRDFYLDANGVTVKCPGVAVGASFTLRGVTYTRRDRARLMALLGINEAEMATSCTTGVTNMDRMFRVRVPPSRVLLL